MELRQRPQRPVPRTGARGGQLVTKAPDTWLLHAGPQEQVAGRHGRSRHGPAGVPSLGLGVASCGHSSGPAHTCLCLPCKLRVVFTF